jgi:hypothetical protein
MAKRRKHQKRRRSRRVGALRLGGSDTVIKLAAVVGGFLLGDKINEQIDKILPKTTDPLPVPTKAGKTIAMVGEIGVGGFLLLSKMRGNLGIAAKVAGGVALGAGIKRAAAVMGILSGYQSVPVIGRHRMAGYQNNPVLGSIPGQLAGRTPPQLSGYRPAGSGVGAYVNQGTGVMGSIGNCDGGSGISSNAGSGYMG